MEPLHITAHMAEQVVYYGDGMHFDGILAYGAYKALSEDERAQVPPITSRWAEDFDLPLERWEVQSATPMHVDDRLFVDEPLAHDDSKIGRVWGWKASAVHADWKCRDRFAVRRRPELEQMIRFTKSPSVNIGAGQQKALNLLMPALFAETLHWYAVGDADEVRRLLGYVQAVGKVTAMGQGRVMRWEVESYIEDLSIEHGGLLRRTMPMGYDSDSTGFPAYATIRAPYHHASRTVYAMRPEWERLVPHAGS